MTIMFCLLFPALYPTGLRLFKYKLRCGWPPFAGQRVVCWDSMLPAHCFWDQSRPEPDSVVSYVFLAVGFVWKLSMLFCRSRGILQEHLWNRPLHFLERRLKRLASASRGPLRQALFASVLSAYIPTLAFCEIANSFAASAWMVLGSLTWGTIQLIWARSTVPESIQRQENAWGFGQVLPVLLLAMPLVGIVSDAYGTWDQFLAVCDAAASCRARIVREDCRD